MNAPAGEAPAGRRVAYVALGSNLGDRDAHLAFARGRIGDLPRTTILAASRVEETQPLGEVPQGPYLNQMVSISTALTAEELLDQLHAIERAAGRERRERWGPRTLDLDIVLMEGESRADPALVLPHPGLADREFWQRELEELRAASGPELTVPPDDEAATSADLDLPAWAVVTPRRRAHIARVTTLLDGWAEAMAIPLAERVAWHDAGRWHDALRDADEPTLRAIVPDLPLPFRMLHGPAAAVRLRAAGERRDDVLDAVHFHTVGRPGWGRTGRALYMADHLEPGRTFAREERAALAARVPAEFDEVFRIVVRQRLAWALHDERPLNPETVAMWNEIL